MTFRTLLARKANTCHPAPEQLQKTRCEAQDSLVRPEAVMLLLPLPWRLRTDARM